MKQNRWGDNTFLDAKGTVISVLGVAIVTSAIHVVPDAEQVANISLLYLLVVMASAYFWGSGPSIVAALTAVLSFNWFFVQPRHTLAVDNPADWLILGIFLVTATIINQLTQNLRFHAARAQSRERETAALSRSIWAVSSQVSHQRTLNAVLQEMTKVIASEAAAILVRRADGSVETVASYTKPDHPPPDFTLPATRREVQAVLDTEHQVVGDALGARWETRAVYLPLVIEQRILGVLYLRKSQDEPFSSAERRMMEALSNHATVALERARLTQSQAEAQVLAESDKFRTALLSMVSHDFRSPLTAIKTSVSSLLQDDLPWEKALQRELLSGINQETDRLNRMVGDILALSRLEAEAWQPQCEIVPIAEVVSAALDAFDEEQNERIQVVIQGNLRDVSLDSVQIVQVLANLLENALKYSPPDSVVELTVRSSEQQLSIEVLDRGYGLPPGEEAQIFERFYRAERWRESALPGTGIGLAICRGLAEAHGGQLNAKNREGGGAVFSLMLPMDGDGIASRPEK